MFFSFVFRERGSRRLGESRRRRELASESWRMRGFGGLGLKFNRKLKLFLKNTKESKIKQLIKGVMIND